MLGAVGLIAYGSLYPFDFRSPLPDSPAAAWSAFVLRRPSRGDLVANLLLYAPLGMALVAAFRWRRRRLALLVATATGAALSVAMESLQLLLPARVTSLTDLLLNVASAAAGAAAAILYGSVGHEWRLPGLRHSRPPLIPLGMIGLWLTYRWAPFVPTIDWQKYKDAVKPLIRWEDFSWLSTARYAVGWLVVARAVGFIWQPRQQRPVFFALVAMTLVAQIVVVGKALRTTEVAGLLIVAVAVPVLARLGDRLSAGVLLVAVAIVVIALGLEPFAFNAAPGDFSWMPFRNSLSNSLELNVIVMLEKAVFYGALIWLLTSTGATHMTAVFLVAPLLGLLEFAQRWLPGRSAEITDPLLAVAMGVLLALAAELPGKERPDPP